MAARSMWKGTISFSMLSIPVRLYTATESKDIAFNTLHTGCGARIKQLRTCSVHTDQVLETAETERGYEVSKGSYVTITDDDLATLGVESLHAIGLSQFVQAAEIDPVYFEKEYWIEPEGIGVKPYALLYQALKERDVMGIGSVTLRTRERLCALRVGGGTLVLDTLYYPDEIRERTPIEAPAVSAPELKLALSLVDTLTEPFDRSQHTDAYRTALMELITARAEGITLAPVAVKPAAEPTGDLMAMLQAAVQDARAQKPDAIRPLKDKDKKSKKGAA